VAAARIAGLGAAVTGAIGRAEAVARGTIGFAAAGRAGAAAGRAEAAAGRLEALDRVSGVAAGALALGTGGLGEPAEPADVSGRAAPSLMGPAVLAGAVGFAAAGAAGEAGGAAAGAVDCRRWEELPSVTALPMLIM
jgi:hypothetical protein